MTDHKWTHSEFRYLENLLSGKYAAQADAYMAAYPKCTSRDYAIRAASVLSNKPWFRQALNEAREQAADRQGITQDRILAQEMAIAFRDPAGMFEPETKLFGLKGKGKKYRIKEIPDMPDDIRMAIQSYNESSGEIKFEPRSRSLDRLGKYTGLLKDESQIFNLEIFQVVMELLGDERAGKFRKIVREMLVDRGLIKTR